MNAASQCAYNTIIVAGGMQTYKWVSRLELKALRLRTVEMHLHHMCMFTLFTPAKFTRDIEYVICDGRKEEVGMWKMRGIKRIL